MDAEILSFWVMTDQSWTVVGGRLMVLASFYGLLSRMRNCCRRL